MNLITIEKLFTVIMETLGMTFISTLLAYIVGLPLGTLLYVTSKNGICKNKIINSIFGFIVNILRSIPCLLLIVILMPLTRLIFTRGTGRWFTIIVPLFFASFPFVSRMVEQSLQEVDYGVIEAAKSLGATPIKIIKKVLFSEARSSLISGIGVSAVSILGYTAFASEISAGGLIATAYAQYDSNTSNPWHINIWIIILLVIALVQAIQEIGQLLSRKLDKRRK